ncbi:UDP-N-acetylglucosamine--N-acetylmuramyl-(pentapeptide) pyrophosphoryl-undecaprenol N-acetylglucosamine transferase [Candidatus Daviesbacteria bacterium]|nr:UDP-N-acetylglucosamine--N-acetylmuramyl-(pentapeptide) pyrophosphoryl-undecaprenol N-acetylglucosamine transferase [Candidatus Daviesbacteria bacterium]
MKVLVTGAHFTPALATIEELKKINGVEVVYVGRKTTLEGDSAPSVESEVLPSKGIKFIPLITGRLQRSFTIYTIPSLLKIPIGIVQSLFIILSEKPDVVLSFGGYVAVPVIFISWLFSVPIMIHEQTLVSGLANKISSWFADNIAVSFPGIFENERVILTGNPIREIVMKTRSKKEAVLPTILITGGNQGSHVINLAVEQCLEKLTRIAGVIHVTGDNRFKDYERLQSKNNNYTVCKWIDKSWGDVLLQADFVVSRAGINTLTELAFLGKPALVVPIPYLYQDEQNKNAKYFENLGLVRILPQSKLSGETLFKEIKLMLNHLDDLKIKAEQARKVIIPDAAKRLALETVLLYVEKKKI